MQGKFCVKKVGYNKSVQALGSLQTIELKVSTVTTFVGVISPFVPPYLLLPPPGHPGVISWREHMSDIFIPMSVCFSFPFPPSLPSNPQKIVSPSLSLLSAMARVSM